MVEQFMLTVEDTTYSIEIKGNQILINGYPLTVEWDEEKVKVNGTGHEVELVGDQALVDGIAYSFEVEWPADESGPKAPTREAAAVEGTAGTIKAIMPGKIVRISVEEGEEVREGQVVAILEAMKMENELNAPIGGVVKQIYVTAGATVEQGQAVLEIGQD